MAFQKPLPEWKQPGIRPPESKIKEGYQVLDKPPAAWMNWQMNTTYEALQELQEKAAEKEDVSQALGEAKAYTDEKVADIDLTKISPESIGAAKKSDLDAHAADAVKHITVAERAAWNQAENNAKSYIDAKPWQRHKVSADDGAAIDITNRDLNGIVHTGFYRGTNLGNAPALLHGWGYVEVITHAPGSWVLQKVYDLHADRFYMRRLTDSGWTAWTQDLFQSGVDAKNRIAGAISAKGVPASANDTIEQLVQKIGKIQTGQLIDVSAYLEIWDVGSKTELLFKIPSGTKKARYLPFMSSYGELWRSYNDTSDANFDISVRDRTGKRITLLRCDYPSDTVINIYQLDFKISERLIDVHSRMDNQQTSRQETVTIPTDFDIDSEIGVWGYVYSSSSKARSTISMKGSLFV